MMLQILTDEINCLLITIYTPHHDILLQIRPTSTIIDLQKLSFFIFKFYIIISMNYFNSTDFRLGSLQIQPIFHDLLQRMLIRFSTTLAYFEVSSVEAF